jgi:ABC-type Na+ transport system ATPase subunit NatA
MIHAPASSVVTPPNTGIDITENEALEEFITKIRDDAALCDLLKQRRARWLEVSWL